MHNDRKNLSPFHTAEDPQNSPFEAEGTVNTANHSLSHSLFYLSTTRQPAPNIPVLTPAEQVCDTNVNWALEGYHTPKQTLLAGARISLKGYVLY